MALLIFLKQPDRAIAAEGDRKILDKMAISKDINLKNVFALEVKTLEGTTVFIATDNIAYIQEISKEKLLKQKEDFEKKQKQQQQQGSKITIPNMSFPKNRN